MQEGEARKKGDASYQELSYVDGIYRTSNAADVGYGVSFMCSVYDLEVTPPPFPLPPFRALEVAECQEEKGTR